LPVTTMICDSGMRDLDMKAIAGTVSGNAFSTAAFNIESVGDEDGGETELPAVVKSRYDLGPQPATL